MVHCADPFTESWPTLHSRQAAWFMPPGSGMNVPPATDAGRDALTLSNGARNTKVVQQMHTSPCGV
eukprot:972131-Prymnesium_polylepis.2